MEEEAFFLFLCWTPEQTQTFRDNKEIRGYLLHNIRASLQKRIRAGEDVQRIHIEFDPLGKTLAFATVCVFKIEEGHVVYEDLSRFTHIVQTEQEALQVKKELEEGGYKSFREPKEKFDKVEIVPVMVSVI